MLYGAVTLQSRAHHTYTSLLLWRAPLMKSPVGPAYIVSCVPHIINTLSVLVSYALEWHALTGNLAQV